MRRAVAFAAFVALIFTQHAYSQTYPVRPVKVVVPYSAGSGADISARVTIAKLSQYVLGNFVIEDKPGASGITGSEDVARSTANGYTLLWAPTQHAINAAFIKHLPYDTLKDFMPISRLTTQPLYLGLTSKIPANSVQELIEYGKAHPGELNYASTSVGGSIHLAGAWFAYKSGLKMSNIVYSATSQAMIDLGRGEVQMIFYPYQPLLPDVQSGRARILASTGAARSSFAPDVPLMAEAGVSDFVMPAWQGLLAPAGTPQEIVDVLEKGLAQVAADPSYADALKATGTEVFYASSKDYDAFLRSEIQRFEKIIEVSGIQTE
jgi:tripartite-type tricarboxylate transporter receptor subunit TctC